MPSANTSEMTSERRIKIRGLRLIPVAAVKPDVSAAWLQSPTHARQRSPDLFSPATAGEPGNRGGRRSEPGPGRRRSAGTSATEPEKDQALWVSESGSMVRSLHSETPFTLNRARQVMVRPAPLDQLIDRKS